MDRARNHRAPRARTRRRWPWVVLGLLVLAVVVAAATRPGKPSVKAGQTRAPSSGSSVGQLPVRSGGAGTPRAVLYRFTNAYGNVSSATAASRYRLLLSLAAPPLLSQLRTEGPEGGLTAVSRLLRRVSLDSLLVRLRVTAASAQRSQATVAIKQWPVGPGEATVAPLLSSYTAELIKADGGWRVSKFALQP
jgi:hypothetical protein